MKAQLTATVSIPTYNRIDDLRRCLEALDEQRDRGFEVLIANGGDYEGVRKLADTFKELKINIANQEKKGIVEARNICWRRASTDIVCIIDDDLVVSPEWFSHIKQTFLSDPAVGGVSGPTIIPAELRAARDLAAFFETGANIFLKPVRNFYIWYILENRFSYVGRIMSSGAFTPGSNYETCLQLPGPVDVDYLEACHMCFRREAIEKARGFDDSYGIVGDWSEPDCAFRVRSLGYRLVFNPKAVGYHCISKGGAFHARTNSYERSKNLVRFYRRWIRLDSASKVFRFGSNLMFINLYWCYKFLETRNPDWLKGISGTLAGFGERIP